LVVNEVKLFGAFNVFVPTRQSFALPLLVDINIAVFVWMVFEQRSKTASTDDLIAFGAIYGPAMHGWGIFRLISSQFIHLSFAHLSSNLYGLVFASLFLRLVLSNAGLITCYVACGLGAGITSVLVHPNIVSAGASGAILGLAGILLSLCLLRDERVDGLTIVILFNISVFVALTLYIGSATPRIDNAAHIGGVLTGFVVGAFIHRGHQRIRVVAKSSAVDGLVRQVPGESLSSIEAEDIVSIVLGSIGILTMLAWQLGIDRGTTIETSGWTFLIVFLWAFGVVMALAVLSMRSENGAVRLWLTRDISVLQRVRRLRRAFGLLALMIVISAAWSWEVVRILGQYWPGRETPIPGVVVQQRKHLGGRQPCDANVDLVIDGDKSIAICNVAGPLLINRKLTETLPEVGQRVLVNVKTNAFGTVATRVAPALSVSESQ
jgi:membrane associated rhomboid family serine protease